jgi:hypothetical protein
LQIPADRVTVVDHPRLRDGVATAWPEATVADLVAAELQKRRCDTVRRLAFDLVSRPGAQSS